MSHIDDLIQRLCPNGVEVHTIAELGSLFGGLTGKSKADFEGGNCRYVTYVNVFNNLAVDVSPPTFVKLGPEERQRQLAYGDVLFTGSSESLEECGMTSVVTVPPPQPLYLNSFCIGLRLHNPGALDPEFSKHLFRSEQLRKQIVRAASGVTRYNVSKSRLSAVRVPVPPMEVQWEIVRVLDLFQSLEAELEARRRQYAHYVNRSYLFGGDVPRLALGDLGEVYRGRRFTKEDYRVDGVGAIHYGELYTRYGVFASECATRVRPDLAANLRYARPGDVVIAEVGETVEDVGRATAWLGDEDVAIHDGCFGFRHSLVPKYVAYYFRTDDFHTQKNPHVARAKVKRLSLPGLRQIRIPVPAECEQQRIADQLDQFEALVNDLSSGLPAELAARRKQYEYYRNRLLTFEEAV
jgi:type I restriction enzyme, S subunit